MTETTFDPDFIVGCYDFAPNEVLTELLENCLKKVGRPKFTIEARELASSLEATFAPGAKESVLQANHIPVELSRFTLHEKCIKGGIGKGKVLPISTEVGDVSHIVPTAQFNICASRWVQLRIHGRSLRLQVRALDIRECWRHPRFWLWHP